LKYKNSYPLVYRLVGQISSKFNLERVMQLV